MQRFADAFHSIVLTLWVGGLWTIGYLVAPTLFATLVDRSLAGAVAGQLFALIGWIGLGSGCCLLLCMVLRDGIAACRRWAFWSVSLMLLISAASLFGIQPLMAQLKVAAMESAGHDHFAALHGISSVLYLLQSLLGLLLVIGASRRAR